jgi:hypothetical protein
MKQLLGLGGLLLPLVGDNIFYPSQDNIGA